jgi:hypothetical protein
MQDMNLDHLALGGGEGAEMLRQLKRRLMRDLASEAAPGGGHTARHFKATR